jgi:hypothetical protein
VRRELRPGSGFSRRASRRRAFLKSDLDIQNEPFSRPSLHITSRWALRLLRIPFSFTAQPSTIIIDKNITALELDSIVAVFLLAFTTSDLRGKKLFRPERKSRFEQVARSQLRAHECAARSTNDETKKKTKTSIYETGMLLDVARWFGSKKTFGDNVAYSIGSGKHSR